MWTPEKYDFEKAIRLAKENLCKKKSLNNLKQN